VTRGLGACGVGTVIEPGAVILGAEWVYLGAGITVSPLAVLVGDRDGELHVGDRTTIGPHTHPQGIGGIHIGADVGIGAGVAMLTSVHAEPPPGTPITTAPIRFGAIDIGDGRDIGIGSMLLPGTRLEAGIQVGAGAVVRGEHPADTVIAGVPARRLRLRGEGDWAAGLVTEPPRRRRAGSGA
jgi:acetyltransferase-like isoleucine patch superfamily enzyme